MHTLIQGSCLHFLREAYQQKMWWDVVFADPFDNIGLEYNGFKDKMDPVKYENFIWSMVHGAMRVTDVFWVSFNAKHTLMLGKLFHDMPWTVKPCVQTFTFGQNRTSDLGNGHRPLWRFTKGSPPIYPDAVKVPSWRQENGDPRAAEGGRVPLDVFDFPRVTGNSKQRRAWHKTQLNEGLVERCLKLHAKEGDSVLDLFAGTGTTLRVAKKIQMESTMCEVSTTYVKELCKEHPDLTLVEL